MKKTQLNRNRAFFNVLLLLFTSRTSVFTLCLLPNDSDCCRAHGIPPLRQHPEHPLLFRATVVMETSIRPITKGQNSNPWGFWREKEEGVEHDVGKENHSSIESLLETLIQQPANILYTYSTVHLLLVRRNKDYFLIILSVVQEAISFAKALALSRLTFLLQSFYHQTRYPATETVSFPKVFCCSLLSTSIWEPVKTWLKLSDASSRPISARHHLLTSYKSTQTTTK